MSETEVFEKIIRFFSDGEADGTVTLKGIDSYRTMETDQPEKQESAEMSVFLEESMRQAEYSAENENRNDAIGTIIAGWLKKKRRLNITRWEPTDSRYPKFMLLGTDKGILAYIEFFYHYSERQAGDEEICKRGICHLTDDLKRRLPLVDSDLDRPVFYIHVLNYPDQKGIYFETTEMIKNNIFERSDCIYRGSMGGLYFSSIDEMGDFEELMEMFEGLKKNNVRFY